MKKPIYLITMVFVMSIMLSLNTWPANPDKTLMLYLPFEEGNGDATKDMSQYDHEANLVNKPSWVDGKKGKALEFTGNNYVIIPIVDDLQLQEAFSVNFWVKRAEVQPAEWCYMVAAGTLKWAVIFNSNGKVGYIWSTSGGGWAQRLVTKNNLTTDWTHVAVNYDVDQGVEEYFNAELVGEGAKPPKVDAIDGSFMVGARNPGQEFFKGIIDEVAIYNRALTLDEIKRDMEAVGGAAVSNSGKLASTWANIKSK